MKRIKVGVAMSGGVDSTSTALMLKDHYNVTGFFMQLAQPDLEKQIQGVSAIAEKINIPLKIIDLSSPFQEKVINYFCKSYFDGLTPNPCMICNKEIKFGLFMKAILEAGMEKIATGHYARVTEDNGLFHLLKGHDPRKDQSYFLARLQQKQLSRLIFPLGNMEKSQIYNYAEAHGFKGFRGEESQDVCFLKDSDVNDFLQKHSPPDSTTGYIKNVQGQILGSHKGIHHYTIGQRRGLGISDVSPYYVTRLDALENCVIVGKNDDLLHNSIILHNLHWLSEKSPDLNQEFQVKIRYTHKGSAAILKQLEEHLYQLQFTSSQRAITPGQFAVLYRDDEVIGSGEISCR